MLQHQTSSVKDQVTLAPQPACACNKPLSRCDYPHCSSRRVEFRPEGAGLGVAPHRREGRHVATILYQAWERAIRRWNLTPEELELDDQDLRSEKEKHQDRLAEVRAEVDAGAAAYMAGIAYDDPILTDIQRQSWLITQDSWRLGVKLFRDGGTLKHDNGSPYCKGWHAAKDAAAYGIEVTP